MTKPRDVHVTGPLAPYAAGFGRSLGDQGYLPGSARNQLLRMAQLSGWADHQLSPADLAPDSVAQFLAARRTAGFATPRSPAAMCQLIEYLRAQGAAPLPAVVLPGTAAETLLARYGLYLERERGLASQSAVDYVRAARVFFAWYSPTAEFDPRGLSSATVIEYVLFVCQPDRPEDPRRTTSRLRSLLRFLFVEGLTDTALAATVPSAVSRADSLPKGVSSSDVARLFASCDRRTAVGRRDFAILTVLVRLGLRASEVASMRLSDIDWHVGELAVRGKGGRVARLPLPVDVGEAVVGWLRRGRSRRECPYVFTRVRAPLAPLSVPGVSTVVARACGRAGLPIMHAHRLRHTAATEMLRAGGSLAEVGQVLRHAGESTTSVYAKVDRRALSGVIQPWPGSDA